MNDSARYSRIVELFNDALDLAENERSAWLEKACDDEAIRVRVEGLLKRHEETGPLDKRIVEREEEEVDTSDLHARGRRVGPWEIEERIGAGGMGVVYRAHRADGLYERTVALKLIAPNAALASGEQLARRLAAERQILARLENDGIARLYDGGVTEEGLPYLALELVNGEPITEYCDNHNFDTRERVELFARTCDAVAYAHRSLVIHRDLKPLHILVVEGAPGDEPGVKLLDFGVSALLESADGDGFTMFTAPHALTPSYAAPEQARGEPVTTATDVYALGVVLYELLADRRPYDLSGKTAAEIEHLITDVEPPLPSAVALPERARVLRGDIDTIVMKALAKEPERRYASAEALAADLRRHLKGVPVEARPATAGYRLRKFVTRHRVGVAMTAVLVVVIAAMAIFEAVRLNAAVHRAQTEAAKSERINAFLQSMLSSVDPMRAGSAIVPESLTVAAVLRQASASVDEEMAAHPEVRAAIHRTIGLTFQNLGLYTEAEPHLREALRLRSALNLDDLHPDLLQSLEELAEFSYAVDDLAQFDSLQNVLLELRRRRFGSRSLEYAAALARRGSTLPLAEADPMFIEALEIIRERNGPRAPEAFPVLTAFAAQRQTLGDWEGADSVYAQAVALGPQIGLANHPTLAVAMSSWASNSWFLGKAAQSGTLVERALEIQEARLPDDHPNLAQTRSMAAGILIEEGEYEEAERLLRQAKSVFEEQWPLWWAKHAIGTELAAALFGQGRDAEGEAIMREHLAGMRSQAGDEHGWTRHAVRHFVEFLDDRGRSSEADSLRRLVGY